MPIDKKHVFIIASCGTACALLSWYYLKRKLDQQSRIIDEDWQDKEAHNESLTLSDSEFKIPLPSMDQVRIALQNAAVERIDSATADIIMQILSHRKTFDSDIIQKLIISLSNAATQTQTQELIRSSGILDVIIEMLEDSEDISKKTKLYALNNITLSRNNMLNYDWTRAINCFKVIIRNYISLGFPEHLIEETRMCVFILKNMTSHMNVVRLKVVENVICSELAALKSTPHDCILLQVIALYRNFLIDFMQADNKGKENDVKPTENGDNVKVKDVDDKGDAPSLDGPSADGPSADAPSLDGPNYSVQMIMNPSFKH